MAEVIWRQPRPTGHPPRPGRMFLSPAFCSEFSINPSCLLPLQDMLVSQSLASLLPSLLPCAVLTLCCRDSCPHGPNTSVCWFWTLHTSCGVNVVLPTEGRCASNEGWDGASCLSSPLPRARTVASLSLSPCVMGTVTGFAEVHHLPWHLACMWVPQKWGLL